MRPGEAGLGVAWHGRHGEADAARQTMNNTQEEQ